MPRLSCLHVSCVSQLPEQQSQDELHDMFESLQTAPLGLHPVGFWQTPTAPPVPLHVEQPPCDWHPPPGGGKAADPQHWSSLVQRSPTRWQPLAGWQTRTPVGAQGAHERLQQAPPQVGRPPSVKTMPPSAVLPAQSIPSVRLQLAPIVGGEPHSPSAWLPVLVHTPEQQSVPVAQASPV